MVLIITQDENELTTEEVIDWLHYLGCKSYRLNGEDLQNKPFIWKLSNEDSEFSILPNTININDFKVVWYRRWSKYSKIHAISFENLSLLTNYNLKNHLKFEFGTLSRYLFAKLKKIRNFDSPLTFHLNKLEVLQLASKVGVRIPKTLVTNKKNELLDFYDLGKRIITKPISDGTYFDSIDYDIYTMPTKELKFEDITQLKESFFPSLFQELIEKEFEIRAYFLNNNFFSIAIFYQ